MQTVNMPSTHCRLRISVILGPRCCTLGLIKQFFIPSENDGASIPRWRYLWYYLGVSRFRLFASGGGRHFFSESPENPQNDIFPEKKQTGLDPEDQRS